MITLLTLFGTYVLFALWQSTFWLAAALVCGRLCRRTPWKAHVWYATGIFAATLTPLLSTVVHATNSGLLSMSVPMLLEPLFIESYALGLLCAIGTALFALALLYGIAASRTLMFHATPYPDKESQDALLRHSKTLRNVSLPILFTSPSVKSPTVWCWGLHPAVLLPESIAAELRSEQRDAVFLHELSHIVRRDHLTALFARLCGAVLFWNPLYWLVLWQSDFSADESCDLVVLTQGNIPPQQYSDTLLRLVAGERSRPVLHFLSRKEKIMKRINRILDFMPAPVIPQDSVIPAQAGIQTNDVNPVSLAPRLRGGDGKKQLWTASVMTAAMLLCVALAFCQEGRQATTNQAGAYTLQLGNQTFTGTVTHEGKPLAGAVVTVTPSEVINLDSATATTPLFLEGKVEGVVCFELGSDEMTEQTLRELRVIFPKLRSVSNKIMIRGHVAPTENSGLYSRKQDLAFARALRVADYLVSLGLPENAFEITTDTVTIPNHAMLPPGTDPELAGASVTILLLNQTVTGKPLAGAVVTVTPREVIKLDDGVHPSPYKTHGGVISGSFQPQPFVSNASAESKKLVTEDRTVIYGHKDDLMAIEALIRQLDAETTNIVLPREPATATTVPVIVKMEPANGAMDVDAATVKELRVTFDVDMAGGFSWCNP